MPQPTPGDVHVNRPLTNVSIMHVQSEDAFLTGRVGTTIGVEKQTDTIVRYKKGAFYRDEMAVRAPGTETPGGGYEMDSPLTYYCAVRGFHHDIPDQVRANTDSPINNDRAATKLVTRKRLINSDRRFATTMLASGAGWDVKRPGVASGSYVAGTNVIVWSDYTNSNPILDVSRYATVVQLASGGFRPKLGITTRPVWDVLKDHPDFVGLVSGGATTSNPSIVTRKLVAEKFELDELIVVESIYDAALENGTWAPAFIGGNAFLLAYTPKQAAIEEPSAFYNFGWKGYAGNEYGQRVKKFRMENLASDRIEIESADDWKLTGADMAALLYDLV